jgi:hypothetical protein
VGAQAGAQAGGQATFYDILKADPSHKLIMRAVDSDPAGKLKALLQQQVPITAFVPTDSVRVVLLRMLLRMLLVLLTWGSSRERPAAVGAAACCSSSMLLEQRRAPEPWFRQTCQQQLLTAAPHARSHLVRPTPPAHPPTTAGLHQDGDEDAQRQKHRLWLGDEKPLPHCGHPQAAHAAGRV